ncbi:hypothetical protein C2G38_2173999 [Gigaspora rosea]|uniref:Uncharacterized protein n=1 Tax=Gigaspora rosea TaxID=44941 RepID=A0A397VJ05_9GLOM|nr:hypothetical protein C2G38_2173999 [Gigaspora rosea]
MNFGGSWDREFDLIIANALDFLGEPQDVTNLSEPLIYNISHTIPFLQPENDEILEDMKQLFVAQEILENNILDAITLSQSTFVSQPNSLPNSVQIYHASHDIPDIYSASQPTYDPNLSENILNLLLIQLGQFPQGFMQNTVSTPQSGNLPNNAQELEKILAELKRIDWAQRELKKVTDKRQELERKLDDAKNELIKLISKFLSVRNQI